MNAIERVPTDLNLPMTGIKVKELTVEDYLNKWVPAVQALNIDGAEVVLRILYFEELAYYNRMADLEPVATTDFTL